MREQVVERGVHQHREQRVRELTWDAEARDKRTEGDERDRERGVQKIAAAARDRTNVEHNEARAHAIHQHH